MFPQVSFLARLVVLKFLSLAVMVALALYAPSTLNALFDLSGGTGKWIAQTVEAGLTHLDKAGIPRPKKGAVELASRFTGMDKVVLFIAITVSLYLAWFVFVLMVKSVWHALTGGARR